MTMNNKSICIVISAVLVMMGGSAYGQTYSLRQVLDSVKANNPALQQFALQTASSVALSDGASAWMAPTAAIGVSEFPYGSLKDAGGSMMPRKMLTVRLQQMFPNFGQQRKESAYYRSFAAQDDDDRKTMQNMLFARAKKAYFDAYIAERKLVLTEVQKKKLQLLLQTAETRLQYGKTGLADVYKAQAKLSDLHSMSINLTSVIDQSAAAMNALMNRPVDAPLQVDTTADFALQTGNILAIDSAYLMTHRSDIRRSSDELHTMKLKQQMTLEMGKPVFGIMWDNMRMPFTASGNNTAMYMFSAMAMISVPIAPWFSRGYKSGSRSLDFRMQAVEKMQQGRLHQALGSIREDWLKFQSLKKELQIFKTEVIPFYAKTYQASLDAFSENTGSIYETLTAWDDLTMKEMEYYDKLGDLLDIKVLLETETEHQ